MGDGDPIASLLLSLAIILVAAKIGGHLAARCGQPPVLGELVAGVVLGNLALAGFSALDYLKTDAALDMLSQLGVILLLFQVGLESTVAQMLKVGLSSLLVATLGVVAPFALGWAVGAWLLPAASVYVHIFLGATLTATSVGITARVLKDLGRSQTDEARIILGAAVIDDVLGLVILAVVTGIIAAANQGAALSYAAIALVLVKARCFWWARSCWASISRRGFSRWPRSSKPSGVLLAIGLAFCFVVCVAAPTRSASRPSSAPSRPDSCSRICTTATSSTAASARSSSSSQPIASFLVPIFFVLMGMRTDLRVFAEPGVLGLAAALTVAAIVGKQLCAVGRRRKGVRPPVDRHRHDPARRSRPDLRQHRSDAGREWAGGRRSQRLLRRRRHGDRHDGHDAARAQVELRTRTTAPQARGYPSSIAYEPDGALEA